MTVFEVRAEKREGAGEEKKEGVKERINMIREGEMRRRRKGKKRINLRREVGKEEKKGGEERINMIDIKGSVL